MFAPQVRKEFMRKSQELPHETLSTILADYGNGPASAIAAAYHPAPIRRIDLELPPSAAAVRRLIQQQAGLGGTTGGYGYSPQYGGSGAVLDGLAGGGSAVELLESMLQQDRQPPTGSFAQQSYAAQNGDPVGAWGFGSGRRTASLPNAAAVAGGPSWLAGNGVRASTNVRSSMLVSESTFIFPKGINVAAGAADCAGGFDAEQEAAEGFEGRDTGGAGHHSGGGLVGMGGSAWGLFQQEQPPPVQRHTYSAPGSSSAGRAGKSGRPDIMSMVQSCNCSCAFFCVSCLAAQAAVF
jgi:hypothetical protein